MLFSCCYVFGVGEMKIDGLLFTHVPVFNVLFRFGRESVHSATDLLWPRPWLEGRLMALIVTVSMLNLERTTILRNRRQGPFESSEIKEDRLRGYNLVCSLADHLTSWPSIAHTCRNDSAIFPFFFILSFSLLSSYHYLFLLSGPDSSFNFPIASVALCAIHILRSVRYSLVRDLWVSSRISVTSAWYLKAHGVLWMRTAFFGCARRSLRSLIFYNRSGFLVLLIFLLAYNWNDKADMLLPQLRRRASSYSSVRREAL